MERPRLIQDIVVPKRQGASTLPDAGSRPKRSIREITRDSEPMRPDPATPAKGAEIVSVPSVFSSEVYKEDRTQEPSPVLDGNNHEPPHEELFAEEVASQRPGRPVGMWIGAFFSSILLIVAASNYFYSVSVLVAPTQNSVQVSKEITARTDGGAGSIRFETVQFSEEAEERVEATGEADVARKASGRIVVYNAYGDKAQRLIKNTRFETPDGKIYRIDESITIPGATGTGAGSTPGQIEVVVYADAPGKEYNIGLVDFTIPGFKGDPRYDKIFAKSKTEMSGGALGKMKVVSDEARTATVERLKAELASTLATKARAQAPQGFVLTQGATRISYEEIEKSSEDLGKNEALIAVRGTVHAVLFSASDLAAVLAEGSLQGSGYDPAKHQGMVRLIDSETLLLAPKTELPLENTKEFTATITGQANFVWEVDAEALAQDLVRTPLANFNAFVGANYPSIARADTNRRPFWAFWASDFPETSDDIVVKIEELEPSASLGE